MAQGWLYRLCKSYIERVDGFSYNFEKNGEKWLLQQLARLPAKVIFDVGANTGDWSRDVSRLIPQARIHAFEISQTNLAKLRKNASSAVVINDFGLSNAEGEIEFKQYDWNQTVNTILPNATFHDGNLASKVMKTRVTTGDLYCERNGIAGIDLLKIDVEGAESIVLFGFEQMLARKAVRAVQFEYGYTNADAKFLMRDFFEFFEAKGYQVGRLQQGGIRFKPWNYYMNDFMSGPNYVAVRRDDTEMVRLVSA
jgi:FkbM family methyltransferase